MIPAAAQQRLFVSSMSLPFAVRSNADRASVLGQVKTQKEATHLFKCVAPLFLATY